MSLDVHLEAPSPAVAPGGPAIFIREGGEMKEISREEWDRRFPNREPVTAQSSDNDLFWRNITHNLTKMASEAGIYEPLWRPDEIGIETAGQLIEPLAAGLERLHADPAKFKKFNPANGWGDYDGLVAFVAAYLKACTEHPSANVRVSR